MLQLGDGRLSQEQKGLGANSWRQEIVTLEIKAALWLEGRVRAWGFRCKQEESGLVTLVGGRSLKVEFNNIFELVCFF